VDGWGAKPQTPSHFPFPVNISIEIHFLQQQQQQQQNIYWIMAARRLD